MACVADLADTTQCGAWAARSSTSGHLAYAMASAPLTAAARPGAAGDRRRTPRACSVADGDVAHGGAGELVEPPGVAEEPRRDTTRATRSRSRCCRSIMIASASAEHLRA